MSSRDAIISVAERMRSAQKHLQETEKVVADAITQIDRLLTELAPTRDVDSRIEAARQARAQRMAEMRRFEPMP